MQFMKTRMEEVESVKLLMMLQTRGVSGGGNRSSAGTGSQDATVGEQ